MSKVNTLSALAKAGALSGKRVFIRADLNVPFDDAGRISEDTRIRASVPGIRLALDAGAAVMVTSHLGRPNEGVLTEADSLAKVGQRLSELLGMPVPLVQNWVDGVKVEPGLVVLLENCRVNVGEKKDDEALSRKMAALCDVYVNDAFGTAHRAEATTHGIARFAPVACAGPLLEAELDALTEDKVMKAIRDKGTTCVIVAHRLSTIVDCDRIYVMERGHIVQQGTHGELYAQEGLYRQLIEDGDNGDGNL